MRRAGGGSKVRNTTMQTASPFQPEGRGSVFAEENNLRVVIADDDARFRKVLKGILMVKGDVDILGEAGNGEEAVELCRSSHPDVVLMDISMPTLNGLAATLLIKSECPQAKVILLTVHEEQKYRMAGKSCGADAFIAKRHLVADLLEGGVLNRFRPARNGQAE